MINIKNGKDMKFHLIVVGRTTDGHLQTLIEDYISRLGHYVPFQMQVIPELKQTKGLSEDQQKEKEGELILQNISDGDWLILMDEGGREFTSVGFSRFLEKRMASGAKRIVFVIGGPYGFAPAVYAAAKEKISLSQMTFSHQMVRLFCVEQLYRAMTILRGEPYHHQ